MSIDPAIQTFFSQMSNPDVGAAAGSAAQRRVDIGHGHEALVASLARNPLFDAVDITELTVPGPTRDVPIRIFTPRGSAGDLPALLYFFGGAFWMRTYETDDIQGACRQIAIEANAIVIEIDYALAPENPYPAALEEGYAVLAWMVGEGAAHGIDASRLAVGGQSSGGCLAASLTLLARDRGGPAIRLQVLEVPVLDLTAARSAVTNDEDAARREILDFYLPNGIPDGDEYASPMGTLSVHGLPPALIVNSEFDDLRAGAESYAARLRAAGIEVVSVTYGGQIHFSPALSAISAAARMWRSQVSTAVAGLHRSPERPI